MLSISEQRKRRRALPRRRLQRGGRRPPSGAGAPHAGGGARLRQAALLGAHADLGGVCAQHAPVLLAVLLVLGPRIALPCQGYGQGRTRVR